MSRTISFSLPEDVFAALDFQAQAKTKSRSEYARDATIAYMTSHPAKGVVAQIVERRSEKAQVLRADGNPTATTE